MSVARKDDRIMKDVDQAKACYKVAYVLRVASNMDGKPDEDSSRRRHLSQCREPMLRCKSHNPSQVSIHRPYDVFSVVRLPSRRAVSLQTITAKLGSLPSSWCPTHPGPSQSHSAHHFAPPEFVGEQNRGSPSQSERKSRPASDFRGTRGRKPAWLPSQSGRKPRFGFPRSSCSGQE